jgi:hypothetical protein
MGMFFTGVCGACCQALVDISAELIVLGFFEITLFGSKYDHGLHVFELLGIFIKMYIPWPQYKIFSFSASEVELIFLKNIPDNSDSHLMFSKLAGA